MCNSPGPNLYFLPGNDVTEGLTERTRQTAARLCSTSNLRPLVSLPLEAMGLLPHAQGWGPGSGGGPGVRWPLGPGRAHWQARPRVSGASWLRVRSVLVAFAPPAKAPAHCVRRGQMRVGPSHAPRIPVWCAPSGSPGSGSRLGCPWGSDRWEGRLGTSPPPPQTHPLGRRGIRRGKSKVGPHLALLSQGRVFRLPVPSPSFRFLNWQSWKQFWELDLSEQKRFASQKQSRRAQRRDPG